jgi:ferric-dicitrate binding protein FerR (iron transport regulator)
VVLADDTRVRVLGTSFAVRSIAGRPGNGVALFSGRVSVLKGAGSMLLRPGLLAATDGAKSRQLLSTAMKRWRGCGRQ